MFLQVLTLDADFLDVMVGVDSKRPSVHSKQAQVVKHAFRDVASFAACNLIQIWAGTAIRCAAICRVVNIPG